jgi:alpha-tubulin suppressor-like RCC1 family protein
VTVEKASLGFSHTLLIEKHTQRLYAFGSNEFGQCTGEQTKDGGNDDDNGNSNNIFTPIVPSVLPNDDNFSVMDVAAGLFHSAVITTAGELVTFGHSRYGQVLSGGGRQRWKVPSDEGIQLVSVVCGRHHTAMVDSIGRVWTMGENKFGQLGRDTSTTTTTTTTAYNKKSCDPTPQLVDGPLGKDHDRRWKCVELQSGWSHLVARVEIAHEDDQTTDSKRTEVYGWGRSDKGQLGFVENVVSAPRRLDLRPQLSSSIMGLVDDVPAVSRPRQADVSRVACGSDSTHFVIDDGNRQQIYSVGWNEHGNLGTGTNEDLHEIQEMPDIGKIVSPSTYSQDEKIIIAAGGAHFLAMKV